MASQPLTPAPAAPAGAFEAPVAGIVLVTLGILVFGVQDVIIRQLSGEHAAMQIMFIRGLVALGPIGALMLWQGGREALRLAHPMLNIVRGLLMVVSYTAYYMAMAVMPIAEVTAIFFVSPIIVTLLSVVFLGEEVGARRWLAVAFGFAGVVVIVRPGAGALDPAALLPLIASLAYAGSIIITRRIGRSQSGASLAFVAMLVFVAVSGLAGAIIGDGRLEATGGHPSLAFLLRGWLWPDPVDALLIGACGLIAACGFYCLAQGYRVAPASVAAPFEFVAMPMAVFWGLVLWAEVPPATTAIGIALIVASGLYVLHRETVRQRPLSTGRGIRLRL